MKAKSTLTLRLNEDESKQVEWLKSHLRERTSSRALLRAPAHVKQLTAMLERSQQANSFIVAQLEALTRQLRPHT